MHHTASQSARRSPTCWFFRAYSKSEKLFTDKIIRKYEFEIHVKQPCRGEVIGNIDQHNLVYEWFRKAERGVQYSISYHIRFQAKIIVLCAIKFPD